MNGHFTHHCPDAQCYSSDEFGNFTQDCPKRFLPQEHHATRTCLIQGHDDIHTHRDQITLQPLCVQTWETFQLITIIPSIQPQQNSSSSRRHTSCSPFSHHSGSCPHGCPHHHSYHDTPYRHSCTSTHTHHFSHQCHSCHCSMDQSQSRSSNSHCVAWGT